MKRLPRFAAGLVIVGGIAATLTMSPSNAQQIDDDARALAIDLCGSAIADDAAIAIVGPRARWSTRAVLDTKAATVDFVRKIERAPSLLVSANAAWAAVHDVRTRITQLVNCSTLESVATTHDTAATHLDVSESGDIALRQASGDITIAARREASARQSTPLVFVVVTRTPGSLFWSGRRLLVLGGGKAVAVDLTASGYGTRDLSVLDPADAIVAAWSYRGLTFALAQDGCVDMLVGANLNPRLRQVACIPREQVGRAYFAFDPDRVRVLTSDAQVVWEGDRLLALSARLTGTVREMTANMEAMARAPWTLSVPFRLGAAPSVPQTRTRDEVRWDVLLKRPYWSSAEAYKHGMASLDAKGWANLHEDGTWTSGTGIALRWQEGPEFVRPSGRSLSSLVSELYHKERYSDAQIENILEENAALGRSLEGRLFDAGWIPVGAAFGPSDEPPLGFFGARLLASAVPSPKRGALEGRGAAIVEPFRTLKSSTSCDVANPVRDDAFSRMVQNGIAVVGRSGAPAQVSKSTNLQLKAESAQVVRCRNAVGVPLRLLILKGVLLNTDEGIAQARAGQPISASSNGVTFAGSQDANWPVTVQPEIIVGIALDSPPPPPAKAALIGLWLDDIFLHRRVDRVLLRVSFLEAIVAADVSWHPRTESLQKTLLVPAERIPATARTVAAVDPACTAVDRQRLYDDLIQLTAIPQTERAADLPLIGIAENAVLRAMPMFTRSDGASAWHVLSPDLRFVPLTENRDGPPDRNSWHGTRVAGILYSQGKPPGRLTDARFTWIDAAAPSVTVLNKLAGRSDIVNVSQQAPDGWSNLIAKFRDSWPSLLLVAAAHNKDPAAKRTPEEEARENDDGMPLTWRLANTIGVGAADPLGVTAPTVLESYNRNQVDLLGPGYVVPLVGTDPETPLCDDGTSYATAYVSAVAALMKQKAHGDLTASQIRARLLATATWKLEYWKHVKGGLVSAERALDGLFENVLTFPSEQDPEKPGLQVAIQLLEEKFSASGEEFVGTTLTNPSDTIHWSDVLRLTKTGESIDASGRRQSQFYMAFVSGNRYRTWQNVTIVTETSAMPITRCTRRSDGVVITCAKTDVNAIFDYVGQRFQQPNQITSF